MLLIYQLSGVPREEFVSFTSFTVAADDQSGSPETLAVFLAIIGIAVAHADQTAGLFRLIDIRAVYGIDAEEHHVTGLSRHRHGVFQMEFVCRQVWRAGAVLCFEYVIQMARLVRTGQKADFSIFMAGVIEVYQRIDIAAVPMAVEWIVLVHRERMAGLGRFDVEGSVVKLDIRSQ